MRRIPSPSLALAATLALALVTLGAAGCAKKITGVDPSLNPPLFPEGVRDSLENSPSDLVVWPDLPNPVVVVHADTTIPDFVYTVHRLREGAQVGAVLDYAGSSGYQMFRRELSGGFRQFSDFPLTAARRWADRGSYQMPQGPLVLPPSQLFAFTDQAPLDTLGYIGRSIVGGISSAASPLTNLAEGTGEIDLMSGTIDSRDSLVEVRWNPVAHAKGYWLHVFQTRADIRTSDEAIKIGLPAAVALGKVKDLFIGYFPASPVNDNRYKVGEPLPVGARTLVYRVLQGNTNVLLRVSAVDSSGRLIADVGQGGDFGEWLEEDTAQGDRTLVFPLGAVVVGIQRPSSPQPARRAHLGRAALESGVPGMVFSRPAQVGPVRVFP